MADSWAKLSPNLVPLEVSVASDGRSVAVGKQRALFDVSAYSRHPTHRAYDVFPDDQRFVMMRAAEKAPSNLVMVDNWLTELSGKLRP